MGRDLRQLLASDAPLVQVLGVLERMVQDKQRAYVNIKLTSEEGRYQALQAQGTIHGIVLAVETILELAEPKEPSDG